METSCVTAAEIADAFMQLLGMSQSSFLVGLGAAVLILSAPSLSDRLFDYLEARQKVQ